jgi:hypothetical protein
VVVIRETLLREAHYWCDEGVIGVYRDFYATMAQVLPVLLLALVWDSDYLRRLQKQNRALRGSGTDGVRFWTKSRVRVYTVLVTAVLIGSIAVALLVLAGALADTAWLRGVLVVGLVMALATLFVRISADVINATREP